MAAKFQATVQGRLIGVPEFLEAIVRHGETRFLQAAGDDFGALSASAISPEGRCLLVLELQAPHHLQEACHGEQDAPVHGGRTHDDGLGLEHLGDDVVPVATI